MWRRRGERSLSSGLLRSSAFVPRPGLSNNLLYISASLSSGTSRHASCHESSYPLIEHAASFSSISFLRNTSSIPRELAVSPSSDRRFFLNIKPTSTSIGSALSHRIHRSFPIGRFLSSQTTRSSNCTSRLASIRMVYLFSRKRSSSHRTGHLLSFGQAVPSSTSSRCSTRAVHFVPFLITLPSPKVERSSPPSSHRPPRPPSIVIITLCLVPHHPMTVIFEMHVSTSSVAATEHDLRADLAGFVCLASCGTSKTYDSTMRVPG